MAQANLIEGGVQDAGSGNDPPEWFIQWLEGRELPFKTPQLIKIEEDLQNLEISDAVRSKIQNAVLHESSVSTQQKQDLDLFNANKRKEDISLLQEPKTLGLYKSRRDQGCAKSERLPRN